jgi:hypothetical protein
MSVCLPAFLPAYLIDWLIDWLTVDDGGSRNRDVKNAKCRNVCVFVDLLTTLVILELHSNESCNGNFELKGIWKDQSWRLWMFCFHIGPGPNPGIELGIFRIQVSCISTELVIWIFELFLDDFLSPRFSFSQFRQMLSRYKRSDGQDSGRVDCFKMNCSPRWTEEDHSVLG